MFSKIILILFLLAEIIFNSASTNLKEYNPMQVAFEQSNAYFKELKLIGWVQIDNEKDAKKTINYLENGINEEGQGQPLKLKSVSQNNYVIAVATSKTINSGVSNVRESIKKKLAESGQNAHFSSIYEGYYNKILIKKDIEAISSKIFHKLNAGLIEKNNDEHFYIYYGYSPLIKDYILINDKKVNINLAFRYNKSTNITYFYVGTPIISMEY